MPAVWTIRRFCRGTAKGIRFAVARRFSKFSPSGHEHAREAALAAEAAGFQGKFWEMHDTLYREQLAWSKAPNTRELFESYAGTLGLNLEQFKKDMESDKARARVDSDHALG